MKKIIATWLFLGTAVIFAPLAAQAGGGGSEPQDVSSGQIFNVQEEESCTYVPDGNQSFYLCLALYPQSLLETPSLWNAVVCKSGRNESGRIESRPFRNDISWRLMQEDVALTDDFFANSGEYCSFQQVDLSFVECNRWAYLRASVVSPVGCESADCQSDSGVIKVHRSCGDAGSFD